MPLDPNIILQGRGVQVPQLDLGQTLMQVAHLKQAQQGLTLGELGLAQQRRGLAEDEALREALRGSITTNGQLDTPELMSTFARAGNLKGMGLLRDLAKSQSEQEKVRAEIEKVRAETAKAYGELPVQKAEAAAKGADTQRAAAATRKEELLALHQVNQLVFQAAGSVTDQPSYDRALAYLERTLPEPYRTKILSETPPTYDPAYVQQVQQMTRDSSQALQQQLKQLELQTAQENRLAGGQVIEGEQGFNVVNPISGSVRPVVDTGGQPVRGKPTEAQSAAMGFGTQAAQAHAIAVDLETKGLGTPNVLARGVLATPIGNYLVTEDRQLYEQAQRNFIGAVLRKESGAAISPQEMENERKRYFPQPGETQAVIEQKRRTRETTIRNLERQAGRPLGARTGSAGASAPAAPPLRSPYGHLSPEQLTPQQRAEEKAWLQQQLSGGR